MDEEKVSLLSDIVKSNAVSLAVAVKADIEHRWICGAYRLIFDGNSNSPYERFIRKITLNN